MIKAQFGKKLPNFDLEIYVNLTSGILVIIGPSGAGKTTLLQCIAGLQNPSWGDITINNRVVFSNLKRTNVPARSRRIGFVFQDYALFPHMTVEKNALYGMPQRKRIGKNALEVHDLLDMLGILHLRHRYPGQISGGEKQRVALARALLSSPELLLLDEPLSALDDDIRRILQKELRRLQSQWDIPFIMVTHDDEEAELLGDQIIRIDKGRQQTLKDFESGRGIDFAQNNFSVIPQFHTLEN